jgi:hypothetical protein
MGAEGRRLGADTRPTSDRLRSAADLLLPSLLAGIDATAPDTTHTAGPALALLGRECPGHAGEIAAPLVERLAADRTRTAVARTLATLAADHDTVVRQTLAETAPEAEARELYAVIREAEPWDLDAILGAPDGDRLAYATAFRQLVRLDDTYDGEVDERADETAVGHLERETDGDQQADDQGSDTPNRGRPDGDSSVTTRRERIERTAGSDTFQSIVHRSAFDDLTVVAPGRAGRYGTVVRARARADDTERGVSVRLLDRPEEAGFEGAIAEALRSWARLVDAEGVVTVADWGTTPRPWAATECVEEPLARRDRPTPAAALRQIRALTGALAQLHQQSVVHGGIDPHTVGYPAGGLDGPVRPMLDSVGLLGSYRHHADPADYLDPRYAAPEYFDSQYGRVDHATDIYHLGMVAYRICTGSHPYDGSYREIRESVLKGRPPAPSDRVDRLPGALDDVLAKATATQKLTRYETATRFHRDVTRICEAVLD